MGSAPIPRSTPQAEGVVGSMEVFLEALAEFGGIDSVMVLRHGGPALTR